jgi:proline iminopeptidase
MIVRSKPQEGYISVSKAEIYYREIGQGRPILVLHGGPDFDHTYLLPELDRLSSSYRLIYYDQRGRGKSAKHVQPEDVSIHSDVQDLDTVREHFQLDSIAILGHSWGGLLAIEYAILHPEHVSHLILMSTAPISHKDYLLLHEHRRRNSPADIEKLKADRVDLKYQEGDPDSVAAYYRIHFRAALRQPPHLDQIIARLSASFTKDGILKARAIENRLMNETWLSRKYNRIPQLIVPIIQAIADAQFVLLKNCGHFAYLECPNQVHQAIENFVDLT